MHEVHGAEWCMGRKATRVHGCRDAGVQVCRCARVPDGGVQACRGAGV